MRFLIVAKPRFAFYEFRLQPKAVEAVILSDILNSKVSLSPSLSLQRVGDRTVGPTNETWPKMTQ